ncbi:4-hydroxy-3-methylbut-2-en-1-yl diphosphate synthase (flavodoxin) [Vallitalea longa]|uniref:4-hydroxy-3-methylbut-2-en-1-yl diphosphate synthase (flavodoxin) n=1 Tax=Vallitalea longa TaxID=2936439 RepID=A0A9W5Y875_9FIRM|nr:flavodoxin-dependent (E)-4-hydroxy-3-methylbut-2-enyl-diphosphate synthase [Vallitalea longa]GKX28945.1 4-hydroxy-3-methylbut-2-en-1-yl diphosphate synthase (flavodoxin) [Vallitalea longa]
MYRDDTKVIKIGNRVIGGGNPILIQSMTNTKTNDVEATVNQILTLEEEGCEIIRVAVPDIEAAKAIDEIKKRIHIPLVTDIHFDYKLALMSMDYGADKIRINPSNIGNLERVNKIVERAKIDNIPIRIGINSGSVEKEILNKYGHVTAEGLVESTVNNVKIIEDMGYDNIVISLKSSDVPMAIKAHKLVAESIKYPIHVGITEAGTVWSGTIKSTVGLGVILAEGIGDTVRVSLTGDTVEEVRVAKKVLETLNLRERNHIEIVSCPTCGRTQIDLIKLANMVEKRFGKLNKKLKIAVMGCVVNGPGEAKEADLGIAGGKGVGLIFRKGEIIKKVPEDELIDELAKEIERFTE